MGFCLDIGMKTFIQFCEQYANYADAFSKVADASKSAELIPMTDEDTATYAAADVIAFQNLQKELGINPTRLGPQMSDKEYKKFMGILD